VNPKSSRAVALWLVLAALVLAMSSSAFAASAPPSSAADDQYGEGQVAGIADTTPTPRAAVESTETVGTLPFTGATLAVALMIGLALLVTGLGIRRITRSSPAARP
jgi:amino acid transporter